MIFLTVGTQLPFDRLTAALDAWAGANPGTEIFGQIAEPGPKGYRPQHFEWVPHLDPAAFDTRYAAATRIVAHAGMGTIIGALTAGKPLLIMPRRADLGEQRNNHQLATAKHFGTKPGLLVAEEAGDLAERMGALLAMTPGAPAAGRFAAPGLIDAVSEAIHAPRGRK